MCLLFEVITLRFENFSTENCCDKVRLYDGNEISAPLLAELSGPVTPSSYASSQRYLYVRFTSDNSVQHKGFSASYSSTAKARKKLVFYYV